MDTPLNQKQSTSRELAAAAWVQVKNPLDRQLGPLGLKAMEALALRGGEVVLDVGCGTGQTLLQLADRVGATGRVIGIDLSPTVLGVARSVVSGSNYIEIVEADAATFAGKDHSVNALFSRFGVMAFPDPVAAFANLRRMLKPQGKLAFVCWRSLAENELDILPLRAAGLEHLADATPFSFGDQSHIKSVLETAGFTTIKIAAHNQQVGSGSPEDMLTVLLAVGALGKILREHPALRQAAEVHVRDALQKAVRLDADVTLRAATWVVTARNC